MSMFDMFRCTDFQPGLWDIYMLLFGGPNPGNSQQRRSSIHFYDPGTRLKTPSFSISTENPVFSSRVQDDCHIFCWSGALVCCKFSHVDILY